MVEAAIQRSLRQTQNEALPSALMQGWTEPFMVPYALALGATPSQAGLLSAARSGVLAVVQLMSPVATHWCGKRTTLILWTAVMQAALWVPVAAVGWLSRAWAVPVFIGLYTLGAASAALGAPAWGSLVSEYLVPERRGRFFGQRTRRIGWWMAVAGLTAGGVLQWQAHRPLLGFALLCVAAAVARAISCVFLARLHDLPWQETPAARFSITQFLRQLPTSNFARFTVCMGAAHFAAHLAAPYVAVYMLQDLQYNYLTYTVTVLIGSLCAWLTVARWGAVADRFGNWVVLRWALFGVAFLPLLWPLCRHPAWLLGVYALGGFLWAGIDLCMVNFVYDAATSAKRTRCLAYFNVVHGCCISLGVLIGGWLLLWIPPLHGSVFITLFCLSAVLRFAAAAVFPLMVREVRVVQRGGLRQVMYDLVGQRVTHILGFFGAERLGQGGREQGG